MMRRLMLVGALIIAIGLVASPAFAEDLEDYLSKAADADYAGTQIVVTVWDGRSSAEVIQVERLGELLMVGADGREVVAGEGKTSSASGGVALSDWAGPHLSDRYTTGAAEAVVQLGREAVSVMVYEDDEPRARIVFDRTTWAPMSTEVYDANGDRFRYASFTNFSPSPRRVFDKMNDSSDAYEVITPSDKTALPAEAAGYTRLDVYADQDGVVQTFYGDGLFSFSVFQLRGRQGERRFATAEELVVGSDDYQVLVQPTDLWVRWMSGGTTYLLVGDLPPDHLEAVLSELPEPGDSNLLSRLWRGLFGG